MGDGDDEVVEEAVEEHGAGGDCEDDPAVFFLFELGLV